MTNARGTDIDKNLNRTDNVRPSKLSAATDLIQDSLRCEHPKVWLLLVRSLAKGEPVTRGCIASGLKMSASDVQLALDSFADLVYDSAGNIVACGLSLAPTPHSFTVGSRQLYTWCALDALMYPVALEQTVQVMSHCPVSDTVVRLTVTAAGISLLSGFESGNDQILKNIKKSVTKEQALQFMKNCRKLGLSVHGAFVMGLSGKLAGATAAIHSAREQKSKPPKTARFSVVPRQSRGGTQKNLFSLNGRMLWSFGPQQQSGA